VVPSLFLTITRACQLRCSYCPTDKDGSAALSAADAVRAVELFERLAGGGDVKLSGGEPLLEPEAVRAVLAAVRRRPSIKRVLLSTNGLGLDDRWLDLLAAHPKAVLLLSLDGRPEDHRRHRRPRKKGAARDCYDHLMTLRERLAGLPRLIVTQTIAPAAAADLPANFEHLCSLGFVRLNFLPVYFTVWEPAELSALRAGLGAVAARIRARWERGQRLYVKNLFTWAPTPLFNTGLVVDADGSIHASNAGLASGAADLRALTRLGSLDEPPTAAALAARIAAAPELLAEAFPPAIRQSTLAVEAELRRFCQALYPSYFAFRKRRAVA